MSNFSKKFSAFITSNFSKKCNTCISKFFGAKNSEATTQKEDIDDDGLAKAKIEEKIKHYQAHGKQASKGLDDPSFSTAVNKLEKEDYASLFQQSKEEKK